jgi:hypothetical protein
MNTLMSAFGALIAAILLAFYNAWTKDQKIKSDATKEIIDDETSRAQNATNAIANANIIIANTVVLREFEQSDPNNRDNRL